MYCRVILSLSGLFAFLGLASLLIVFNQPLLLRLTAEFRENQFVKLTTRGSQTLGYRVRPHLDLVVDYWVPGVSTHLKTDEHGLRTFPAPTDPKAPRLLFFGNSTAFGMTVSDQETFTYLVGEHYRDRFQVENQSAPGWNYVQSYRRLMEVFEDPVSAQRVRQVFITWSPGQMQALSDHFYYPGKFEYFPNSLTLYQWRRKNIAVQAQYLAKFQEFCRGHGISFAVVILARKSDWRDVMGSYNRTLTQLRENGIQYLDFSDILDRSQVSAFDSHPGPAWHRLIAQRLIGYLQGSIGK